jgi:glycosyltransferase involved in cell wall biosynthesis
MIGRIYQSKRQLDFVMAAHKLIRNGIDSYYFIIGRIDDDVYHRSVIDYIEKHNLADRVYLTGHRNDVPQILSSLDVLVSLSGGSIMYEGMASSKAVISAAYTKKENSHHLQDRVTGLVTDSRDVNAIAGLMAELASNASLRSKLGENAHEWAKANFSCRELAAKTEEIYNKFVNEAFTLSL